MQVSWAAQLDLVTERPSVVAHRLIMYSQSGNDINPPDRLRF